MKTSCQEALTATVVPFLPAPLVRMTENGWRRFRKEKERTTATRTIFNLTFITGSCRTRHLAILSPIPIPPYLSLP